MNTIQDQVNSILRMTKGMLFFRAAVMLITGCCMLFAPLATLWWMTIIIGAIILVDGGMMLAAAIAAPGDDDRGVMIINSVLMLMLGIFSLLSPVLMDMVWVLLLGIWQLLSGMQYLFLRKKSSHTFFTLLNGILSVLCGIFFILMPFAGLLAASWLLAILLMASGVLALTSAVKL